MTHKILCFYIFLGLFNGSIIVCMFFYFILFTYNNKTCVIKTGYKIDVKIRKVTHGRKNVFFFFGEYLVREEACVVMIKCWEF